MVNKIFRNPYLRITLYYAVFGLLWILFTDRLLFTFFTSREQLLEWQIYKGWFFIAVSTLLIYRLLAGAERQRQDAHSALTNNEKTYRLLFENNPLPMWVYDLETLAFLAVNEAAVERYGFSRDEFLAMSIRDIRPPEDITRLLADVSQTTRRLNYAGEWRHRRIDGTIFPVEITSHELVYNGRSARLVTANDLTERKKAETDVLEKSEILEKIFDNIPLMLCFTGQDGRIALANREFEQKLGWSLSEIQEHPGIFREWYPDDDYRAYVLDFIKRGEGTFAEFCMKTRSGQIIDTIFANVLLSDGTSIGIGQDLTGRKKVERDLKESEARFRTAIEEAPFPIIIHAEDGEIIAISHIWTEITGYRLDEIPTVSEWTKRAYGTHQEQIQAGINRLFDLDERLEEGQFHVTCKDGSRRIWEFSTTPLGRQPDGRRIVISVAVDVTERTHAETALRAKTEELDGYFRYALDLLCIADLEGRFRRLNKEWESALGYSLTELEGQRFLDFVHPDDVAATEDAIAQLADQKEVLNFVNRYRHQNGSYRWIEWRAIPAGELIYAAARDITERIETEQRLRLQSAALEAAANGIVITDTNGNVEWVNPAFTKLTGFTIDEALGKNPRELVKSGKQDNSFYEEMWQTILNGCTWRGEIINKRKDGTLYTEEEVITPVKDDQGKIAHFIAIKQDISRRKKAEEALRHSEARLAAAQRAAKLGSWEADLQTGANIWSDEMYRLIGVNPTKMPDFEKLLDLIHPDDRGNIIEAHRLVQQTHDLVTFEFRTRPEYGPIRSLIAKVQLSNDANGQPAKMIGTVQDITDHKQAEAEREYLLKQVKAQAEQLSQVMRSVPEGVLLLNPENQILIANPQGQEYAAQLAKVSYGNRITHLGDTPLKMLQTSPPAGQWHEVSVNGRVYQVITRPVETGPVPQGWVLVLRDVTEQQEVQKQLQQQERLAAVGQLAAGIAHDFNNIMAVIVLYSQILELAPELSTRQKQQVITITRQAKQASELIQQILDFSRRSLLAKRPLDLLSLLQNEITLLQRTLPEHIDIKLDHEPGNYMTQADPTRLQQAIMNLAINARDAMPHGGQLRFDLAPIEVIDSRHPPYPGMMAGSWIRLMITDTGHGIAPNLLEHVFEPFFTTKEPGKGTGLGLAQVHGIIGQHGGFIDIESKVGQGTTFTSYLPSLTFNEPKNAHDEAEKLPQGQGKLLLVVEDKAVLREALVETLAMWEYRILEAANGEEALAHLSAQGEEIKLVLSDVIMPQMGGIALVEALRQQGWSMPVILMTGHPLDTTLAELSAQGVRMTLAKPINATTLARAVMAAIEEA